MNRKIIIYSALIFLNFITESIAQKASFTGVLPFRSHSRIIKNPQGDKQGFRVIFDSNLRNVPAGINLSLQYSTIIGGSGWDYGHGITVDDAGNVYIAGQANSSDYPTTPGSLDPNYNGNTDVLLSKLSQNGSELIYSTYIGGSGRDDTRNVFLDKSGCVYLTGSSKSSDFPVTPNAMPGNSEGYLLKIDSSGNKLLYSTKYIGGEILLTDKEGNLIILGTTTSPDFPATANAFSRKFGGGQDIFLTKINPDENKVIFSTLIGGSGSDWASSMTIDKNNNIIITGRTNSKDYPLKGKNYGSFVPGKFDIIVTKIKPDGRELVYSTLLGGTDDDWAFDVTTDNNCDIYIAGTTKSADFPTSDNAYDTLYNGEDDAILFKLSSDGTEIKYSTFLGGSLKDSGRGVSVNENGIAYVTGCARSNDFPVTDNAFDKTYNGAGSESWAWGDPFFLVMNSEGTQVEYSTYFGGSNDEEAYGIDIDHKGGIYICGITSSIDFPATEGAFDRTLNGGTNIYVAKFQIIVNQIEYQGQDYPGHEPVLYANGIVPKKD